jgi:ferredoxin
MKNLMTQSCRSSAAASISSFVLRGHQQPRIALSKGFMSSSDDVDQALSQYLKDNLDINTDLHKGIIKAMQPVFGKEIKISHMQSLGVAGMQALAASVTEERKRSGGLRKRPFKWIHFSIPHHGTEFDLKWRQGESLLDVAKSGPGEELLGEYMEGTCGGQMSCCTCHVYLDSKTYQLLPTPCEAELDMLDLAYEPNVTSRLGCQVFLLQEPLLQADHAITVTIPADVNNVWK